MVFAVEREWQNQCKMYKNIMEYYAFKKANATNRVEKNTAKLLANASVRR